MNHNFGEKTVENGLPVTQSAKYQQSKAKAIELIESGKYDIADGDFWILMNTYANGTKMLYTGLIISHNACLKINDHLAPVDRFNPSCVTIDKDGYNGSLVYTYCNPDQGMYEVGEVSAKNCKNSYPYAMAFKRLFDRVVLKQSKLAYYGVYSDSEADEFKKTYSDDEPELDVTPAKKTQKKDDKPAKIQPAVMSVGRIEAMKAIGEQFKINGEGFTRIKERLVSEGKVVDKTYSAMTDEEFASMIAAVSTALIEVA